MIDTQPERITVRISNPHLRKLLWNGSPSANVKGEQP
jgi:hypothetical protein